MSLEQYKSKRNFNETVEPLPNEGSKHGSLVFVVQRHHASRLHYDFRLAMGGVLKSWAIPKGPSMNPKDKRLAMMVEDHPYAYRSFEGRIPPGNYGAGMVSIFDEGTYEPVGQALGEGDLLKQLEAGNIKFKMHGKMLKGEFALVKLKNAKEKNAWLLVKHADPYAISTKFDAEDFVPQSIKEEGIAYKKSMDMSGEQEMKNTEVFKSASGVGGTHEKAQLFIPHKPMLAKLSSGVFDNAAWVYERKVDGYRAIAYVDGGGGVKLISRNGIEFQNKYQVITQALAGIKKKVVLDGELVVEDANGNTNFQLLQNYEAEKDKFLIKYYVFDLLALEEHDLRQLALIKRKELLKVLINQLNHPLVIYNEHVVGEGKKLYEQARTEGWEGIIAKKLDGTYHSGQRSNDWLKFKLRNSQEAIIVGYTKPAGGRRYFGSLVLAINDQKSLRYVGNCGTGFNMRLLKDLFEKMDKLKTSTKPLEGGVHREAAITWVKPSLVCEVTYTEWTLDKHLRHPVFKGLRIDKSKEEVEEETVNALVSNQLAQPEQLKKEVKTVMDEQERKVGKHTVKLTHLNKVFWQNEGITKGDLLAYYEAIASYILPYLKDRPLALHRHPNGINAPAFFQKDLDPSHIPSWIKHVPLFSESNQKNIDYLVCNNLPSLLWMINLGCIEVNPWLSTYNKPDNPVFAVLDLDPNDVDDFGEVVKVALTAKNILTSMNIEPFIKTSGSRGLHIFIHVGGKYTYNIVKDFIQFLGRLVHAEHPDITSLERSPSKRKQKIYLDFLQNGRGQTIVAPYSVRPKPGASVSTPIAWEEVNDRLDPKAFHMFNTVDRIQNKGDLWEGITVRQANLKKALELV